jgi:nucleoside-diphosphate-sugar epimerase
MIFYLIGARGRLGQAIAYEYAKSGIVLLDRSIYEDWSQPDVPDLISRYFDKRFNEGATVFVASGLLDPKLSQESLLRVNYHLPKNLIDGAAKLGIKIITFGTVMEGLLQSKNPYIQTKTALGEYVNTVAAAGSPVIHLQIHTLYGVGQPSPFMFLGQMLTSIRNNVPFKMTSGQQLREYHHLADEAKAIRKIAMSTPPGIVNLSHGKPLSLKTIAEEVFKALRRNDLLRVGALPEPPEENYEIILNPIKILQHLAFRDSLPAIVQYMQECRSRQEGCERYEHDEK